jgi:hypothetical protein
LHDFEYLITNYKFNCEDWGKNRMGGFACGVLMIGLWGFSGNSGKRMERLLLREKLSGN